MSRSPKIIYMVIGIVIGISLSLLVNDISNLKFLSSSRGDMYITYFDENISWLEKGSPVTYQGLEVGTVEDIRIAPNKKNIEVYMMINLNNNNLKRFIAQKLIAQLEISKKTGKMIVNLRPRIVDDPVLMPMFPTLYPVISSAPSKLP